jgi:methionine-rich copper-binding protein CopC
MNRIHLFVRVSRAATCVAFASAINFLMPLQAQQGPTIVSVVPANGVSGVAATTPVNFQFSEAVDTTVTTATFIDTNRSMLSTVASWNAAGTILTCTPNPAFPSPDIISWYVSGQDAAGNQVQGFGSFSTGPNTGCSAPPATNTSFQVGSFWIYAQSEAGSPPVIVAPPLDGYSASAIVTLASNVTASAINLTLPGGTVQSLFDTLGSPLLFEAGDASTNLSNLDVLWTNGTYTFEVQGASPSDALPAQVELAFNVAQPDAPQIANFAAAQAVNPAQPFTLHWNPFSNASSSSVILVSIGYSNCPVKAGFEATLPGTATSVTIPADTLKADTSYSDDEATILFSTRTVTTHKNPDYEATASRDTITHFTLVTTSAPSNPPPSITKQPANASVKAGAAVTFTVSATGTGSLSYQWQLNGVDLVNGADISGATTDMLKIKNAQAANAGSYSVIVSDTSSSVSSATATLTVAAPPLITTQPRSKVVAVDSSLSFTVGATGTPPLSYRWKRNGANLSNNSIYSGTATATLTITSAHTAEGGGYTVVVTDAVGSVTSAKATLTVDTPPSITTQPTSRTVVSKATATFSVKAAGSAPLSYHWRENGTDLVNGGAISGATTPTLTISKVQTSNAGTYSVLVTNLVGSVISSNAVLTVSP